MSGDDGSTEEVGNEIRRRIDELDFQGDTEAARRLCEEGRTTIDHQLQSLDDIDSKAISLLRVNIILVGLILTAASFISDSQTTTLTDIFNPYFAVGVVALIGSSALAALTYTASDSEVGIEDDAIEAVLGADLSELELEVAIAESQSHWIRFNNRTNLINAPLITLTTVLIVVALVHLAIGVYDAVIGSQTLAIAIASWVLLVLLVLQAELPDQLNDLREEIPMREWRPW